MQEAFRFWISWAVPEIFAIKVGRCKKSTEIYMFWPHFILGGGASLPPRKNGVALQIQPVSDHLAKFHGDQLRDLERMANKKAVLSQRWPSNAPYIWVPWNFLGLPIYAHVTRLLFPTFSWAFVPIDPMNVPTKFEVHSFTHSWDNRGIQKIWAVPGYAHAPFSPKFWMGFYLDWPCKCTHQIWSP